MFVAGRILNGKNLKSKRLYHCNQISIFFVKQINVYEEFSYISLQLQKTHADIIKDNQTFQKIGLEL